MEKLTQEVLDRLYTPVGEIVVQWGLIDIMIQYLAFAMFRAKGTTPKAQGWPVGFGYRLSILEDRFKKWPELKAIAGDAKQIFKSLRTHKRLRDMLAHGAASRYDREKDAVFFRRIDRSTAAQLKQKPEETHRPTHMLVRFSMLARASNNCTVLTASLVDLRDRVAAIKQPK